ncbi:MAG: hypothetical protein HY903_19725 [Deltaproteobacteria bacterium]|nr:hypothetical protein [Deltaproteobacteria bacterium]
MTVGEVENRCRGVAVAGFATVLAKHRPAGDRDRIVAALPPELREALGPRGLDLAAWYPLSWYKTMHAVTQQVLGVGVDYAREVGRLTMRDDLGTGIYKVFTRFLAPGYVVASAARVFGKYYEHGTMTITEHAEHFARAEWSGCRDFDRNVWEDLFGGCIGGLEAASAKNVQVEVLAGGKDGDVSAVLEARWA